MNYKNISIEKISVEYSKNAKEDLNAYISIKKLCFIRFFPNIIRHYINSTRYNQN